MKNKDLWISCYIPEYVSLAHEVDECWLPYMGSLRINVVCDSNTTTSQLENVIHNARNIRVGNEAHFPMIIVWIRPRLIKKDILNAISKLDIYTPRIRLVLIDIMGSDTGIIEDIIYQTENLRLNTSILYIAYDELLLEWQHFYSHIQNCHFLSQVHFEWFSTRSNLDNWEQCLALIRELSLVGYNFSLHPLATCGGVAYTVRALLLSQFGKTSMPIQKDKEASLHTIVQYKDIFQNLDPPCSLGVIRHLFKENIIALRLRCTCISTIYFQIANLTYDDLFNDHIIGVVDDRILLEDWQYIYDGFDYV